MSDGKLKLKSVETDTIVYFIFSACTTALDVGLVIDTSGSINEGEIRWPLVVSFLEQLVIQLDIERNNVRIGAVQFSDKENLEWTLAQYNDRDSIIRAIGRISYRGGRTNVAGGLELARTALFNSNEDRPGVQNIVLLITDGVPNERVQDTIPQADALKRVVDRVVSVGVTNNTNQQLLEDIASSRSDVIRVERFDTLIRELNNIVAQVCAPPPAQEAVIQG